MYLASQLAVPAPVATTDYDKLLTFTASPVQTRFRGVGANYMGFAALAELGLTAQQKTDEFDRAYTSGIKIARTLYAPEWAYASWPSGSADWTSASMTAFYTWLSAMQSRGINVAITMGWHFPQNIGAISTAAPITPTPTQETNYWAWVSESLNQMINVRGYTNITHCLFFTEPNSSPIGVVPVPYTPVNYYKYIVDGARAKIAADDGSRTPILPRIKIMGAEEFSFTTFDWLTDIRGSDDANFDGYCAHSYCQTPTFAPFSLSASNCLADTPWQTLFSGAVSTASPKELWADETGTLVGGDSDSTGYRATADWGWQLARQIHGHMQAGVAMSMPWMLQDQRWYYDHTLILKYGSAGFIGDSNAVYPSWYALSMVANLMGGGGSTSVYSCTGGTSTLHGTAASIPYGVRPATNADGEWSFMVINESTALDVQINLATSLGGRTVYRHSFSGEYVPATASNPAYLLPWDRKFSGVTTTIPTTRIPGRSVVVFSTMPLSAPTAENLALTATVGSDVNPGFGAFRNVANGNPSNVLGATNTWRKPDNSSHYVQLTWPTAQTIGRVELSFVATTAGVVYADYTTTATPAPLADYTVEYWNGSSWVQVASVTGNAQANRSHTFAPVSTTALRLNATSAAATAGVNNFGAYAS